MDIKIKESTIDNLFYIIEKSNSVIIGEIVEEHFEEVYLIFIYMTDNHLREYTGNRTIRIDKQIGRLKNINNKIITIMINNYLKEESYGVNNKVGLRYKRFSLNKSQQVLPERKSFSYLEEFDIELYEQLDEKNIKEEDELKRQAM